MGKPSVGDHYLKVATMIKNNVFTKFALAILIGLYMCNSALMLVCNKLAVHLFPAPSALLLMQLGTSWFAMFALSFFGLDVTPCSWDFLCKFWPVAFVFLGTIFCGLKAIQYTNIETFIIFRAATPIVLSVCDYLFLGRELPSRRSCLCLIAMIVSAVAYVMQDSFFVIKGYMWIGIWYFIFVTDFLVIKHKVTTVKMTNWGRVYYTNGLASLPLFFVAPNTDFEAVATMKWSAWSMFIVALSCFLGLGMSYFSFKVRSQVTSTYFAIIGNVCKVISVVINYLMWDFHASPLGLGYLGLSLVAAYFYQQAPLRDDSEYAQKIIQEQVAEEAKRLEEEADSKENEPLV